MGSSAEDIELRYPMLTVSPLANGLTVSGAFPVIQAESVLARFVVEVEFPKIENGMVFAPVTVNETGGSIPRIQDRHVGSSGACCLYPPEYYFIHVAGKLSPLEFLLGPVHGFFISQLHYESFGTWPNGEYSHEGRGIAEFYQEFLGIHDAAAVLRFLLLAAGGPINGSWSCYCGSGRQISRCRGHLLQMLRARKLIPRDRLVESTRAIRHATANFS